jgi:phospholipase/carboxylesterase
VTLFRVVRTFGSLKCCVIQSDTLNESSSGVVILNHGFGASGEDLVDIGAMLMDECEDIAEKFRFVFPEAPIDLGPMGMPGGRAWWPINMAKLAEINQTRDYSELTRISPPGMPEATAYLATALQEMRVTYRVEAERIVLGGFSQGAMVAMHLTLSTGFQPALLAQFSGTLLCRDEWTRLAIAHPHCRVLQSHGFEDPILPFGAATELSEMLTGAGFDVDFIPFHGGHTIPMNALQKLSECLAVIP